MIEILHFFILRCQTDDNWAKEDGLIFLLDFGTDSAILITLRLQQAISERQM
jgi:hypothetical protein